MSSFDAFSRVAQLARPYEGGSSESCSHPSADGTTLEIMVFGWDQGSSDYSIKVTWTE